MRITSKGQVTIPQAIRQQAGLHPGSEVDFSIGDGKVVIRPAAKPKSWAREALERALDPFGLARESLPREAAFLAAQAYQRYRKRGGTKRSPLPEFYIGAHASIAGHALLTRDPARYREHFPKLKTLAPE